MKLKKLAAALLLAGAGSSFAAIAPGATGDGELFVVIQDSVAQISYTLDLGIRMADFLVNGQLDSGYSFMQNLDLGDGQFASFLSSTSAANYRYAVLAVDSSGPVTASGQRLLTTAEAGTTDATIQSTLNANLRAGIGASSMTNFLNAVNSSGTHQPFSDFTINGASTNSITDSGVGYFGEAGGTGPRLQANALPFNITNLIGVSSFFYLLASQNSSGVIGTAGFDLFNNAGNTGSFLLSSGGPGYSLSYSIAAIPEPTGISLLLAGVGALGFVARRRRPV